MVTVLTEEHGRLTALARGARRSRRRFAGALGLLVLARYQLRPRTRGELWTLDSADVVREWTSLATDLAAFAHTGYALDLVRETTPAEQPEPEIFALVVSLFDALGTAGPAAARLRGFELALLALLGSAPSLGACVACATTALDGDGTVFDPTRGGIVCATCAATSRGPGVRLMSAGARRYLLATSGVRVGAELDAATDPADRAVARDAMVGFIEALVGRSLKSVEFIAKVGAGIRR